MAYSDLDDLVEEMGEAELARISGDPSGQTVNEDKINYAIANADAMINAYLGGRFQIPLNTDDPIIVKLSIDLAVSNLYEYSYSRTVIPTTIVWRRLNAIRLLKDIQTGNALLVTAVEAEINPPTILTNKSGKGC
jgi:phage gp36-like protein